MLNTIIMILVIVAALAALGYCTYIYLRDKNMEQIRADVYRLFLQAEHTFTETKAGKQKMEWVVQKARSLLPEWLQNFITEPFLYMVIQAWFDAVKDLLDDGKYNGSVVEETADENE